VTPNTTKHAHVCSNKITELLDPEDKKKPLSSKMYETCPMTQHHIPEDFISSAVLP